jgi:hypothetical protein
MAVVFGKVAHPPYKKLIVVKPWEGAGFTRVAPRSNVGVCNHETWGYGNGPAYQAFFGTGGERQADALVDYYIDQDGTITMLNDPRGTRAPWASGGDNPRGDGPAFIRKLGALAINSRLVSIENEGKVDGYTPAQLDANARLCAYWFDQAKVPWDAYPLHPGHQIVTDLEHWEFGKECPFDKKRAQTDARQDLTRGYMRAAQEQTAPTPLPPPSPIENPGHAWWPAGWTEAALATRFGELTLEHESGWEQVTRFDPLGAISNAWVARGAKEGLALPQMPRPLRWWRLDVPGAVRQDVVAFEQNWRLQRVGDRDGFQWV